MLVTHKPPNYKTPFTPTWTASWALNNAQPNGMAYGIALKAGLPPTGGIPPYSNELVDLVQVCLMEVPASRPALEILRSRIRIGLRAALAAGGTEEPWEYFTPAEPSADDKNLLCIGRAADGRACHRNATAGGYCTQHQDQRLTRPSQRQRPNKRRKK